MCPRPPQYLATVRRGSTPTSTATKVCMHTYVCVQDGWAYVLCSRYQGKGMVHGRAPACSGTPRTTRTSNLWFSPNHPKTKLWCVNCSALSVAIVLRIRHCVSAWHASYVVCTQITYQKGGGAAQHVLTTAACTAGKTLQKTFNDLHFNAHQGLKVFVIVCAKRCT